MPVHEAVHEGLFVAHVHLLGGVGGPELDALAVFAGEGHGVGQHVIELGERRGGEAAHPIGPLGLDALEDRLAVEHGEVAAQLGVIAQQRGVLVLFGARVLDDAELEAALAGEFEHLVNSAVVQVDVEIHAAKLGFGGGPGSADETRRGEETAANAVAVAVRQRNLRREMAKRMGGTMQRSSGREQAGFVFALICGSISFSVRTRTRSH